MLVSRWQAPRVPDVSQIRMLLEAEGLSPVEEVFPANTFVGDHRHPFDEIRVVAHGEMLMNVAGNKLLLRAGDRIIIPANTKHTMQSGPETECLCIVASRGY